MLACVHINKVGQFTKPRNGVPAWNCLKTLSTTAWVGSVRDIIQDGRVRIKNRINKSDGLLSGVKSLLVDQVDDASEDRGRGTCSARVGKLAFHKDCDVITLGFPVSIDLRKRAKELTFADTSGYPFRR